MKIKKELICRRIAGDTILVPVGSTVLECNGLFALNGPAAFIWDLLSSAVTEAEIVSAVVKEYEVSAEQAAADVGEFLAKLRGMEIID